MFPILKERGVTISLLFGVLLPPIMHLLFKTTSMAAGLVTVAFFIILRTLFVVSINPNANIRFRFESFFLNLLLISFPVIHIIFSGVFLNNPQDAIRFLSSLLSIVLVYASAIILAHSLILIQQDAVVRVIKAVCVILIGNAIISLIEVNFFGVRVDTTVFLFAEPSHFAIVSAPFLIYYVKSHSKAWVFVIFIFFAFAITIENMTMMVAIVMAMFVEFRIYKFLKLIPIFLFLIIVLVDTSYFVGRLQFSPDTANLSGLVFMQGWENAYLTLLDTFGWGCGFQQFGIASSSGEYSLIINEYLSGGNLNILDGGTTASKLIGEFGLFGLFLVLFFVVKAIQSVRFIWNNQNIPNLLLFQQCVQVAFLLELFVRGVGYFSPTIFLYILTYVYSKKAIAKNK